MSEVDAYRGGAGARRRDKAITICVFFYDRRLILWTRKIGDNSILL